MPTTNKSRVTADPPSTSYKSPAIDWEDARIFLEVTRHKSLRAAADHLGQSVNAVRRHLDRLEESLGITLFTRHVDGVKPTPEGVEILAAVQQMETASFGIMRARDKTAAESAVSVVKLAITEGLGAFWIAPRLRDLEQTHPNLLVDLHCAMPTADVFRLEADIAVQFARPTAKDARVVKLGRIHAIPYATQAYIDAHGLPRALGDLAGHRIVVQIADQIGSVPEYAMYPKIDLGRGHVGVRTNVSSGHYSVIAAGAGIGVLPTYISAIGSTLIPVDIEGMPEVWHDIWLVYHPDAKRIARVRFMIDWLIEAFSPQRFPWFADKCLHPRDFPKTVSGVVFSPFR